MSENKSIRWDVIEAELRKAKFELAIAKHREQSCVFPSRIEKSRKRG